MGKINWRLVGLTLSILALLCGLAALYLHRPTEQPPSILSGSFLDAKLMHRVILGGGKGEQLPVKLRLSGAGLGNHECFAAGEASQLNIGVGTTLYGGAQIEVQRVWCNSDHPVQSAPIFSLNNVSAEVSSPKSSLPVIPVKYIGNEEVEIPLDTKLSVHFYSASTEKASFVPEKPAK